MFFCVLHHPMEAEVHTSHLENKNKRNFSVGIRWLGGRSLHTRSIAQIFVGVVLDVSSHLYSFCCGSDCMKALFFMSAVACRPVTPRLWSEFLVWLL